MPKYAELHPEELQQCWDRGAAAVIPWGALEWHGQHLPLGLDGIVAEAFAERLVERIDGVLLPGVWLPITTLPHPSSLRIRTETLRAILDDMLAGLFVAGARTIVIVTGHYAQGHLVELYEGALRAMEDYPGLCVFVGTPLQTLGDPHLLDHAARYETSQLLALRPRLVRNGILPEKVDPKKHAVLGAHPDLGNAAEGEMLLEKALDQWCDWLRTSDPDALFSYYRKEFDQLQPYVDAYFTGSWDEALDLWWEAK